MDQSYIPTFFHFCKTNISIIQFINIVLCSSFMGPLKKTYVTHQVYDMAIGLKLWSYLDRTKTEFIFGELTIIFLGTGYIIHNSPNRKTISRKREHGLPWHRIFRIGVSQNAVPQIIQDMRLDISIEAYFNNHGDWTSPMTLKKPEISKIIFSNG